MTTETQVCRPYINQITTLCHPLWALASPAEATVWPEGGGHNMKFFCRNADAQSSGLKYIRWQSYMRTFAAIQKSETMVPIIPINIYALHDFETSLKKGFGGHIPKPA